MLKLSSTTTSLEEHVKLVLMYASALAQDLKASLAQEAVIDVMS